ncbi:helix-turn-helix domain-containing protein [Vaginisenegalia massiliensis]|uniref:helix-turn-helix domain-containing protein n=1 Tax=Vaginisenegalia massiliensis TaxID=2058294 RepID=UPI000F53B6D7|nr:helix-turn-helix transcriptional regulator [Vaginisenegalia massiliensis]
MILADKIIYLRKQMQLTQEQLAEQLDVSRQSISKWEGSLATPDLNKIMAMSRIFGVSTDFLVNDQMTLDDLNQESKVMSELPVIDLEQANEYLENLPKYAKKVSHSVILFIVAIIPIALADLPQIMPETKPDIKIAGAVSLAFLMVAVGVGQLILAHHSMRSYRQIGQGEVDLAYGVDSYVRDRIEKGQDQHVKRLVMGVGTCIASFAALIFLASYFEGQDLDGIVVMIWLLIVALGVYILVREGIIWSGYHKLMDPQAQRRKRSEEARNDAFATIYWSIVTAGFLGYSFLTKDWGRSWVVWPIAGILYAAFEAIVSLKR